MYLTGQYQISSTDFFLINFAPNLRIFTIISKVNILNNCNSQILETMPKESEWS